MTMNMDGVAVSNFRFKFDAVWAYVLCICVYVDFRCSTNIFPTWNKVHSRAIVYTIRFLCGHRARAEDFSYVVTLNLSILVS